MPECLTMMDNSVGPEFDRNLDSRERLGTDASGDRRPPHGWGGRGCEKGRPQQSNEFGEAAHEYLASRTRFPLVPNTSCASVILVLFDGNRNPTRAATLCLARLQRLEPF